MNSYNPPAFSTIFSECRTSGGRRATPTFLYTFSLGLSYRLTVDSRQVAEGDKSWARGSARSWPRGLGGQQRRLRDRQGISVWDFGPRHIFRTSVSYLGDVFGSECQR